MFFDDFQTRDQNYHLMLANIFSFENISNNSINLIDVVEMTPSLKYSY